MRYHTRKYILTYTLTHKRIYIHAPYVSLTTHPLTLPPTRTRYRSSSRSPNCSHPTPSTHPHPSEDITLAHPPGHSTSNISPPPIPSLTIGPPPLSLCADTIVFPQILCSKILVHVKSGVNGSHLRKCIENLLLFFLAINFSVLLISLMKALNALKLVPSG